MNSIFLRIIALSRTSQLLLYVGFLSVFQCNPKNEIPNSLFLESYESQLLLSYNTEISSKSLNSSIGLPQNRSKPEFDQCLHLRPTFYRLNETGLNLSYCSTTIDSKFNEFIDSVFSKEPTAFPVYETVDVSAKVVTPAMLRNTLGSVRLLYCENDCSNGFQLIQANQIFNSTPFQSIDSSYVNIQRRFYRNEASLAISDQIWLLYRLPYKTRILAIKIGNHNQAQQVIDYFNQTILMHVFNVFDQSQDFEFGTHLYVSGSYSGNVGAAGNEELILSTASQPIKVQVKINDNQFWLTLFGNSSVVLNRDNPIGFKYQTEPNIKFLLNNNTEVFLTEEQFKPNLEIFDRVAIRETSQSQFKNTGLCLFSNPCSQSDIPIEIATEFDTQLNVKKCRIQDLDIIEINPFGIFSNTNSGIDIGGKFIELGIYTDCLNRSLFLKQQDLIIALPERLNKGILLLSAEKSYFNEKSIEYTALRRLKPEPITIHDSMATRKVNLEPIQWIYGSRDGTPGFSKVHSLVNRNGLLIYHDQSCVGLRFDYCNSHAMSPGNIEANIVDYDFVPEAKISEILPYLNNRFIELYCSNCNGQAGRIDLLIERISDHSIRNFAIPIPNQPVISISPTTVCGGLAVRFADLYLPASAAIYQLGSYDSANNSILQILDTWNINQSLYSSARAKQSSILTDGISIFESNDDIPDGCQIRSSPNLTRLDQ